MSKNNNNNNHTEELEFALGTIESCEVLARFALANEDVSMRDTLKKIAECARRHLDTVK